jgi:nifR3 family TIM-barrel protein
MDGISDFPFRFICKQMGSALSISEFINAMDVPQKLNDFSRRTTFCEFERPFGLQVYGATLQEILAAARDLEKLHPDFIDINLGCSVRRIVSRGAGAGLLKQPQEIKRIINGLTRSLSIPLTVKMRLGWDDTQSNFLEIAKIAQDEGASMISVHARRRDQSWNEPADWTAITEMKNALTIPIIGNGDVRTHEDIQRMLRDTNCDGVMIGRAALGNPWLFSQQPKESLSAEQIRSTVKQHWLLMLAYYGRQEAVVRFKKHLKAYLSCQQFSHINLQKLLQSNNPIGVIL